MGNIFKSNLYSKILESLNLKNQEVKILINGLDAAGKTTMLYRLAIGEVVTTIPTIGFNVETIEWKNFSFTCWDVGGRDKIRPLWRHYFVGCKVLIFLIDSCDRDRIDEAKDELSRFLNEDELKDCIVLIMANKQDLPNCMTLDEIEDKLCFQKLSQSRKAKIIGTVATTGEGLEEGLNWISTQLAMKTVKEPILETYHDLENIKENYFSSYFFKLFSLSVNKGIQ